MDMVLLSNSNHSRGISFDPLLITLLADNMVHSVNLYELTILIFWIIATVFRPCHGRMSSNAA